MLVFDFECNFHSLLYWVVLHPVVFGFNEFYLLDFRIGFLFENFGVFVDECAVQSDEESGL